MSVCNLHQSEYVNASHCLTVIVAWHPSAFGDHECDQFMVHQPLETNGSFTRLGSNACCGWGPAWEWQYLLDLLHLKMLFSRVFSVISVGSFLLHTAFLRCCQGPSTRDPVSTDCNPEQLHPECSHLCLVPWGHFCRHLLVQKYISSCL